MTKLSTQEPLSDASNSDKQIKQKQVGKGKTPEEILSIIAKAVLWIGISVSVILILGATSEYFMDENIETGNSLLVSALYIAPMSIVSWAVLKVLCNISNNIREINEKIK